MSNCNQIKFNYDKICIRDLRHKVSIYTRSITAPNFLSEQSTKYTEDFTLVSSVWAAVQVVDGVKEFDTISLNKNSNTHNFYIRYRHNITQENWLDYQGLRYDILKISNLNLRNKFIKLYCSLSGDNTKAGSQL